MQLRRQQRGVDESLVDSSNPVRTLVRDSEAAGVAGCWPVAAADARAGRWGLELASARPMAWTMSYGP
jgi:hypothetical protein